MTDFMKVWREMPLSGGAHSHDEGKACVMEKVAILYALAIGRDVREVFSALPPCTNEAVACAAQVINDWLGADRRQRLSVFIPRLLRARRTEADENVNLRLFIWWARKALNWIPEDLRPLHEEGIEAVEAYLAEPSRKNRIALRDVGQDNALDLEREGDPDLGHIANAWEWLASGDPGLAAREATLAVAARGADLVDLLDEILDQWELAVTKEGEDLYVPQVWEDEALAFIAEMQAEKDLCETVSA